VPWRECQGAKWRLQVPCCAGWLLRLFLGMIGVVLLSHSAFLDATANTLFCRSPAALGNVACLALCGVLFLAFQRLRKIHTLKLSQNHPPLVARAQGTCPCPSRAGAMEQTGPQTTHPQLLDVGAVALLPRAGAGQPRQRE
jgi:hypothetical protein